MTVDKKEGTTRLADGQRARILDLPGTYSLNPSSIDEDIAVQVLSDSDNQNHPDVVVVVADAENLKRNLLLFTQVKDLGLPTLLAINMQDRMKSKGISIDIESLASDLKTEAILISTKENTGIQELKEAIQSFKTLSTEPCFVNTDGLLDAAIKSKKKQQS